jgi:hypothetical protein
MHEKLKPRQSMVLYTKTIPLLQRVDKTIKERVKIHICFFYRMLVVT